MKKYIRKKNDLRGARTGATYGDNTIFEEGYLATYVGILIKLGLDEAIRVLPQRFAELPAPQTKLVA